MASTKLNPNSTWVEISEEITILATKEEGMEVKTGVWFGLVWFGLYFFVVVVLFRFVLFFTGVERTLNQCKHKCGI